MISVTGGFNQQFVAGAPKIHKLKYATDSFSLSDAIDYYAFRENISDVADTLALSDAISALLTTQHFNDSYADDLNNLLDTVEASLAEV